MTPSIVREKIRRGENILCVSNHYPNPDLVELIGMFGFDCLWTCNEHVGINRESLQNVIRACRITGMDSMIRIVRGNYDDLIQPLEMGAKGLMIPHITTAEEARRIVQDIKFQPLGRRGIDGVNADADMGFVSTKEYTHFSNENTFLVLQIEEQEALDRVDEIASVKGVDVLFVGPGDLALDMGIPGEIKHPKIQKAIERVAKACQKNNIYCGTPGIDAEYSKSLLDRGAKFLAGGGDYGAVRSGMSKIQESFGSLGFSFRKASQKTSNYAD